MPCGGQKSVRGNSVNLPIDIAPTVDMLPRTLDNTETIAINYKMSFVLQRLCFQTGKYSTPSSMESSEISDDTQPNV